jgi:hypothetical protein
MAIEVDTSEDVSNDAPFLKEPGDYHVAVIHAEEEATYKRGKKKGELRGGFCLDVEILAGPQKKKVAEVFCRHPAASHKDGGDFCRKVQQRTLEAISVVNPSDRGKKVTVELVKADGTIPVLARQCIVRFEKNDEGYIELSGANIWHIDDPDAPQCERNQEAVKLYTKFRRDPKSFVKADGKPATSNGNGSASGGASQQKQAAGAGAAGVDLEDI